MTAKPTQLTAIIFALYWLLPTASNAAAKPQRIVSISLCTDQLLLMMAERTQIASVTTSATNPQMSWMADAVGDIPLNNALVEEIVPHQPDLIVGGDFAARDTRRFLRQLGYQVKLAPLPTTIEEIYTLLSDFGDWIGNPVGAATMIAEMKREIADIQARYAHRPEKSMIIYTANGFTIGAGTLEHDVLTHAGFRNLSAEMGIRGFQQISLERVIEASPDFLQMSRPNHTPESLATAYIGHPALDKIVSEKDQIFIPSRMRACAGPMVTEAIEFMARKR